MRDAVKNAACPHCGGPTSLGEMSLDEQQLRMENVRLKEEVCVLCYNFSHVSHG